MITNLYEYQNKKEFTGLYQGLEEFLDDIWRKREKVSYYTDEDSEKIEIQQFIQFIHKSKEIKSNKYVGVIHFEGNKINLLPKIFFDNSRDSDKDVHAMQNHILWWLSYCRKIKFPNYQTSLGSTKSDFFEILIYLFAKYTNELLSNSVYQQYEEVSNELSFIKGRLNTNEYITENLSKGRWHKLNCTYDSFVFDNSFNRIIKYVTTLLYNATKSLDNKRNLREILFILDEVSDVKVSANDCLSNQFNPLFGEFETVRDYCYLFLNNSISLDYKNDLKLFAFLIPMEYVFEDFIFGFIEKEIEEVKPLSQIRTTYLDKNESFLLRPDLYLKIGEKNVIADTKYKIIYSDIKVSKNGISQNDLYQMVAYGIRFKVDEIKLFYPDTIKGYQEEENEIIIKDELAGGSEISIKTYQLPVINRQLFENETNENLELKNIFRDTKIKLKNRLEEILVLIAAKQDFSATDATQKNLA
jgi:5-methylcytosine-specific restriction enzyme subunit McrC